MYVQGFLVAVPEGQKDAYRDVAARAADKFAEYGVTEIMEAWEEDVPDGKVTDFRMATKAEPGEKIVFSWMIWPDKATCDAAHARMQDDSILGRDGRDALRRRPHGFRRFFAHFHDGKGLTWEKRITCRN